MGKQLKSKLSYGLLALALMAAPVQAYTYKVVHVFNAANGVDGSFPQSSPILGKDGNIYGTTAQGGTARCGTLYKLTPDGTLSYLHQFAGWQSGDGCYVKAGLTQDKAGNLYGTTTTEGGFGATGGGIVYKMGLDGKETILHSFNIYDHKHDGFGPFAAPIVDNVGAVYGTTTDGGPHNCGLPMVYCGVIYRIRSDGDFKIIYAFKGRSTSAFPTSTLIPGGDGYFYGTAPETEHSGYGTVFRVTPKGDLTNVYSFLDHSTGGNPGPGLIKDRAGNFYGVTNTGGTDNLGAVFKVTADGAETVLHSFTADDGSTPQWGAPLAMDKDGNLYGTTFKGGPSLGGVVFQLAPDGTYTVLHGFDCDTGPCQPVGGVLLDSAGNIFGTTEYDDPEDAEGIIFELAK